MTEELSLLDATAQAMLVKEGEVTPLELVDAAIERIERLNGRLNAVIHERFDRARKEADDVSREAPFAGVPMVVKDLDGFLAGEPYHAGSRHLRDNGYVATSDSWLFERFRDAGLVVVGKSNTPELGLKVTTEPLAYGPCRNPWDLGRSTGGSSGGSAAAVASGMVPVGHAGDGGGSIRAPASECGLVGLKPSRGRSSFGPDEGEAWAGLVCRLAVTRTVRDTAGLLDAAWGTSPGDPYTAPPPRRPYVEELDSDPGRLRIGFVTTAGPDRELATDCVEAVERTVATLEVLRHEVVDGYPEALTDRDLSDDFKVNFLSAYPAWIARDLQHFEEWTGEPVTAEQVEPGTWEMAEFGRTVTATAYIKAVEEMHGFARRVAAWWDRHDVLVTPTLTEPPPTLGQFDGTPEDPLAGIMRSEPLVTFTLPFNVTGQPAVSLPLHWNAEGLPIGVQLVAAYGREDLLIRLASQLEQALPWADRVPPVHA
ncbi:MAG: 6-aminohexanoate-cyclic-dimer hydrolase [Acidimicrobiales bacterium]|nr:MAG: amidase [Actinomycetota bacterium]MBV6508494.1 6-aminohexanoate-cyclic-dimer hydrolase [Acidimicrobiales bacterium]RIK05188.1 MAG: hypothetical protein DCC48_11265 [Acidobacteriota bacterium]